MNLEKDKVLVLEVEDIESPYRIDKYIFDSLEEIEDVEDISRNRIQSLIESGDVLLNGETVKKNARINSGDLINIRIVPSPIPSIEPEDIPIDIVYEDDDLIIVNKKKGMVVHPAPKNYSGTLVNALMFHFRKLSTSMGDIRPGIVHRIDKDTSGILMVAKNDFTHLSLAKQLKERTVNRRYVALCHGGFKEDSGRLDFPIARSRKDRKMMAVDFSGKRAVTNFEVVEKLRNYSLLVLKLETGRTHQIRVHLKHINHPVVGDMKYGPSKGKYCRMGQLLHAKSLGFIHPGTGKYMEFDSEIEEGFRGVLNELGSVYKF